MLIWPSVKTSLTPLLHDAKEQPDVLKLPRCAVDLYLNIIEREYYCRVISGHSGECFNSPCIG